MLSSHAVGEKNGRSVAIGMGVACFAAGVGTFLLARIMFHKNRRSKGQGNKNAKKDPPDTTSSSLARLKRSGKESSVSSKSKKGRTHSVVADEPSSTTPADVQVEIPSTHDDDLDNVQNILDDVAVYLRNSLIFPAASMSRKTLLRRYVRVDDSYEGPGVLVEMRIDDFALNFPCRPTDGSVMEELFHSFTEQVFQGFSIKFEYETMMQQPVTLRWDHEKCCGRLRVPRHCVVAMGVPGGSAGENPAYLRCLLQGFLLGMWRREAGALVEHVAKAMKTRILPHKSPSNHPNNPTGTVAAEPTQSSASSYNTNHTEDKSVGCRVKHHNFYIAQGTGYESSSKQSSSADNLNQEERVDEMNYTLQTESAENIEGEGAQSSSASTSLSPHKKEATRDDDVRSSQPQNEEPRSIVNGKDSMFDKTRDAISHKKSPAAAFVKNGNPRFVCSWPQTTFVQSPFGSNVLSALEVHVSPCEVQVYDGGIIEMSGFEAVMYGKKDSSNPVSHKRGGRRSSSRNAQLRIQHRPDFSAPQ